MINIKVKGKRWDKLSHMDVWNIFLQKVTIENNKIKLCTENHKQGRQTDNTDMWYST